VRTEYSGPTTVSTIRLGTTTLRLVRPAEPDRLLDDGAVADLNRHDDYMPYWAYLWPGAYLLAEAVLTRSWSGERALEIGCGLGLAGLAGLSSGLNVHFTDYDDAPLDFVARSVAENGLDPSRFSTGQLDWRSPPTAAYSLILGADVLYERKLVPLVASVLARMLAPWGEAWIADPYRVAAEEFPLAVCERGLTCTVEPVETTTAELGLVRGTLHRVRRLGTH
jgi:predicted nicotinamide N-methyase